MSNAVRAVTFTAGSYSKGYYLLFEYTSNLGQCGSELSGSVRKAIFGK